MAFLLRRMTSRERNRGGQKEDGEEETEEDGGEGERELGEGGGEGDRGGGQMQG